MILNPEELRRLQDAVQKVQELIRRHNVQIVDLRFNDLPGLWQHFSMPVSELTEMDDIVTSIWVDGVGFDGSSIRGFQKIQESDMILLPDPATARIDPLCQHPTLAIICDVYDPLTKQPYSRDPRYIAKKAEEYLKSTGVADTAYFGPEPEFFIFDDVRFDYSSNSSFHVVDSVEGTWNTASSSSSMTCASTRGSTTASTTWTRWRGSGTQGGRRGPTWATSLASRRATSLCPPTTPCRTCAARSSSP